MNTLCNYTVSGRSSGTAAIFILLLVVIGISLTTPSAANPLTGSSFPAGKPTVVKQNQAGGIVSTVISRIIFLQMQINKRIASHVHNFRKDGKIIPLLPLFLLAFAYGAVHAAGPGHGKAIAMTYTLAKGRSYGSGLLLGMMIALIHAGSAILLVFLLRVVLEKTISTSLTTITRITQIVSYGMICSIGLYICISSISSWFRKKQNECNIEKSGTAIESPLTAAIAIGIVPCPGVIMILLFCLSLEQSTLGFLLCCAVSIGMALTITFSVWLSLAGKKLTLHISVAGKNRFMHAEQALHCLSGVALASVGGLLLAASL